MVDIALASIAFRTGPKPCPVVIGRAGGNVGCIAVRALDIILWRGGTSAQSLSVPSRGMHRRHGRRCRCHLPAPFPAPRAHDLGRPQSRETIAVRLISPPAKAGSSRSLRFK
jgi:hypothetical protein